jgi:O-antigen/teichoic acid export membrane protein
MTVRNLLTVNTVYVAIIALVSIFVPVTMQESSGVDINDFTTNLTRIVGAVSVGYGVTSWLMRNEGPSGARRAFLIGAGIGYPVVAVVFIFNWFSTEGAGISAWAYAVISLLFGFAFLYFARDSDAA